jgi:FxsC-like protein
VTPYFLLHHARVEDDSSYVERFFDDVQSAVFALLGQRAEFAGRLLGVRAPAASGGGDEAGEDERVTPFPMIMSCPVLVALYSDAYFSDRQCLAEWSLFRERVRWHRQFTGRSSSALIGVRWSVHAEETARMLADIEVLDGDFGVEYQAAGGLRLMRTEPASASYRNLVGHVADAVVRSAGDAIPTMSEEDVKYVRVPRPLAPAEPAPAAEAPPPEPAAPAGRPDASGTGSEAAGADMPGAGEISGVSDEPGRAAARSGVGVVLAVAPAQRQPARRTQRVYYGDRAADWRPFLPEATSPAFEIAKEALKNHFFADVVQLPLDDDLAARLGRAVDEDRVLVLLVDPWIAASEEYSESLALLGEWRKRHPSVAGTLVIVNPSDGETLHDADELRDRLRRALLRDRERVTNRTWRDAVHTADQLVADTIPLVARTRNVLLGLSSAGAPGVPRTPPRDGAERESRRPILRRAGGGRRGHG